MAASAIDDDVYNEDGVRAPMESKVEQLSMDPRGDAYISMARQHRRRGTGNSSAFHPKAPTTVFDVLRDFKQEEKFLQTSALLNIYLFG